LSNTAAEHRRKAPEKTGFAVITCSSTRHKALKEGRSLSDESGDLASALIIEAGHRVILRSLVPNREADLRKAVQEAIERKDVNVVFVTGGTGLSPRDITVETLETLLEKPIPGFGELFRRLSYEEVGLAAMLTRASAGAIHGKALFAVPGSPHAVQLALKKVILPEVGHIVLHLGEPKHH